MSTAAAAPAGATERSPLRAVALPSEHGGWGLTLEPVLLGLLLQPSIAGACLGLAAFLAFLARTPLKLVAVDRRRERWLPRTWLALRVGLAELVAIAALAAIATSRAGGRWWWAVAAAAPLVAVELWFDVRSRGRRLVPELCGAAGVAATAAAVVLAGGGAATLAAGAALVLAARAVGAIPFVRAQIMRARRGDRGTRSSDLAQLLAIAVAAIAVVLTLDLAGGLAGVAALAALQSRWVRRDPPAVKVLGLRQMALGLALVALTAAVALV